SLRDAHNSDRRGSLPQQAGEGGAQRRMGCGPLLRSRQACATIRASFAGSLLLSTPHPSGFARHLPHFVEKGARNDLIFERKQLRSRRARGATQMCAHRRSATVLYSEPETAGFPATLFSLLERLKA